MIGWREFAVVDWLLTKRMCAKLNDKLAFEKTQVLLSMKDICAGMAD